MTDYRKILMLRSKKCSQREMERNNVCLYVEPDYPYIHRELAKPGVTLTLLWEEYCRFRTLRGDQSAAQIWCEIECFNELAG